MNDVGQHLILHHLDDPLRILHWTVDEAVVLMIPAFGGFGIERPLWGLICAGLFFWGLRNFKKRFGLSTLRHALYWYWPKFYKRL